MQVFTKIYEFLTEFVTPSSLIKISLRVFKNQLIIDFQEIIFKEQEIFDIAKTKLANRSSDIASKSSISSGLAIAKTIIELHNGKINLNKHNSKSQITIELPVE